MIRVRNAALLLVVPMFALAGCSITGDWKLTEVKPQGKEFPLSAVSFADDGSYTATSNYGGKEAMSSGTYKWTGTSLTVTPKAGAARSYSGHVSMGNKLVLTHKSDKGDMTGVMEKQKK